MEDLTAYLNKLHDTQAKDERNRRLRGKNKPNQKLPGKQHSKDN